MPDTTPTEDPPRQSPFLKDVVPNDDLANAPNDADDTSDAGKPTTDHDAAGWRTDPPAKP